MSSTTPRTTSLEEITMMLHAALDFLSSGLSRRRGHRLRTRCPCSAGRKLFLEPLEARNLLAGGLSPSLVALGGATPLPIALPLSLAANPLGGMDIYQNFQGPADADPSVTPLLGNEPNQITNFNGSYGGVRVQGYGTDGAGQSRYWDADLRFMKGIYRGLDGRLNRLTFIEI
jgi:hypothetical protein